jgi:hypothetical protein
MKRELLLLLLLLTASLPARGETGLALAPMRIEIQIPAGGQYTDTLRLSNDSDGPSRVRAELLDWYLDETLTPQFAERYEQEKAFSCRDWLQVNPREMDMLEGGALRIRYTLRVPANTPEGEYHCGAGFVTLPPIQPSDIPMGMHIAVRAVAAIYVTVGSPASEPSFKDLGLRGQNGVWEAVALFENQGLRHYRVQGFVELTDAQGQVVDTIAYPYMPVLPKRRQLFPVRFTKELAPGTYTLRSHADVGLPEVLEATTQVTVPAQNALAELRPAELATPKRATPTPAAAVEPSDTPAAPAPQPMPAPASRPRPVLATTATSQESERRPQSK